MRPESSIGIPEFMTKHGVSRPTVHRHIRMGKLKSVRGSSGKQRITTSAEAAWLGTRTPKAATRS